LPTFPQLVFQLVEEVEVLGTSTVVETEDPHPLDHIYLLVVDTVLHVTTLTQVD
jgi:hypothetical protein